MTRPEEIVRQYLSELDKHIADLKSGRAETTFEIQDMAALLHIHPVHLSNTIKQETGQSPCDIYEEKLMQVARQLLTETRMPIGEIAHRLTFDPSNFTKFFRHFEGVTPRQFRKSLTGKTELLTN